MILRMRKATLALGLSLSSIVAFAQSTVKGTIKDAQGEPLIGVTINVDGKPAAITDLDGNFNLPEAKPNSKISVSYVGYKKQTITLGNQTSINIILKEDDKTLDEVVVVGYGQMKKSDLTGSIATIHSNDIVAKGASNVLNAMQGQIPGVNITQSSSRADGSMSIQIRGKSSINSNTTPLFVVDGVICDNIDFLNEQDIQQIDILKDASSTAIYGSRATAGVVIVTTKGGLAISKGTKPSISYDGYYGISVVSRMPDFQQSQDFYNYRFLKFQTYAGGISTAQSGTPGYEMTSGSSNLGMIQTVQGDITSPSVLKNRLASGVNTNWPSLVTQNGHQQNHYISVSGSGQDFRYNMGLGYHGIDGVYIGDKDSKISFKGSADANINKYVSAGFNLNIAKIDHKYASNDGVEEAYRMNPFMQAYDENGNIITNPGLNTILGTNGNQFTSSYNPLVYFENETEKRETWRLMGNIYLSIKPIKNLIFKTTFSPNYTYYRDGQYQGTLTGESINSATKATDREFSWTWENTLTYDKIFNKIHHINVMGMMSMEKSNTETESLNYTGVLDGTTWYNLGSGTYNANGSAPSSYTEYRMLSYAMRANYTLSNRYMATATIRWDGSSRFREGKKWGSFPSFALAWRISEENFIKNNTPWISNLKLRLSYGQTGNNTGIGDFAYQLTVAGPNYYPFGSTTYNAMRPSGIVDPDIHWEKSHEFNLGLDYGFLNSRINGSIDWYHKKSTDLLYPVFLPLEVGGIKMKTNLGSVLNTGLEASITGVIIQNKDWNWSITANYAHNSSHVKQIDGTGNNYITGNYSGNLFINGPVDNVFGYQWAGIVTDKTMIIPDNEIAKKKGFTPGMTVKQSNYYYTCYGWTEGSPIIKDINGDGKFTSDDERVFRADPAWTGSISTNLNYKGWDFSTTIYTKQHYWVYSNFYERYTDLSDRGRMRLNMDYYIPAGTLINCDGVNADGTYINPTYQQTTHYGSYPFPNNGGTNGGTNNSYWEGSNGAANFTEISFTKIKNITLGYTFPKKWTSLFGCSRLRLYVTVTDPFVITSYKGFDPEWADATLANDGPSQTTWQFGANIKF